MFLAVSRILKIHRLIVWTFFPFKIPILKNSSLIGIFKKFQKMFNNFYPKSSFFLTIVPTAILTGRSVPRWWWLSSRIELSKVGPFFKEPVVFVDPQQVVLMLTRLRAVWHVLLVSNFEFLVNLKIFWGGEVWSFDRIYALPHNLSKKFLYGMKPSSSSLSASSSRSLIVSSLGISSPKLVKKFSSSANIMVPFSFLS